jgi:hypothetical protein
MVRSSAYKVLKRRETIAIAASKACRPFHVPRQCRGQHLLAAVVASVVAVGMVAVAETDVNFIFL